MNHSFLTSSFSIFNIITMKHLMLCAVVVLFLVTDSKAQSDNGKSISFEKLKKEMNFNEKVHSLKGKPMPEFSLNSLDEGKINSSSLLGKPTVLNFWFTSCQPCLEEIPILNSLTSEFDDEVNFLAITFQKEDVIKKFLKNRTFDFKQIVDARDYIKDFGVKVYPKLVIVDKNGIVTNIYGKLSEDTDENEFLEKLKSDIHKALNQSK